MRVRLIAIVVAMGLVVAGLLVPAAWADTHGEIIGIQWQWAELTETEPASQTVVLTPERFVLVLNADGSAPLKADCNVVHWTYTLEGHALIFDTLGPSTRAYCGDDSLDQLFLSKLGTGGTVSVESGRMVLDLNESAGRMVFDNGGPAETAPETIPETGGAPLVVTWAAAILAGLGSLAVGATLRRRKP